MASNTETAGHKQEYHIGYKEDTLKAFELRNVKTCLGYLLPTLEALPPTFSLLDVGCGPGSITFDLARRFPQAKIIGVDIGTEVIARNNANIPTAAPGTGIEFRAGNILEPESFLSAEEISSGFDVVHEHTTLICIPNNIEVLRQMKRLAKQDGGIVACREGDTHSQVLWPPCPESAELQERIYKLNGLDTQTGRKLVSKALEVGFPRDQITASASVLSNITRPERELYGGSMLTMLADENSQYRKAAAQFGYTEEQVEVLRKNMERFIASDDAWRLLICTEVICKLDEVGR
ncbi:S-adenosyl-L-methionine-dependent methyltransferase [Canariomyces notabilis]|uniref:S-adenosyl-L-methionine-dependent methyltransferase n=1 Tax=Canariomyces notabilis TaxID=2074819 RepID=A0AAN6TEL8_9PEZI|nr:S-adenosyl-L-methionine-dependent methyltransferase [Canariomyces arenarius]